MEGFSFHEDFQDLILASVVKYPETFLTRLRSLKAAYFSGVHATIVATQVLNYWQDRGCVPDRPTLRQLCHDASRRADLENDPASARELDGYLDRLFSTPCKDHGYVLDRLVEFCRERATLNAIREIVLDMRDESKAKKKKSALNPVKMMEEALGVGRDLDDLGLILHRDYGKVIEKVGSIDHGVRTGYAHWDSLWRRGWLPGWLVVPLGPPKSMKTGLCINLATNMIGPDIGADVIYFTCELSQDLTLMRALCRLGDLELDDVYLHPGRFKAVAGRAVASQVAGNLLIKEYPAGTATIQELDAHVTLARRELGLNPRAVFIDFAETILPAVRKDQDHREQADIYTAARALGQKHKCAIIMPDRCNRETVNSPRPTSTSFQGAIQKGGIVDVGIGLCFTEDEYLENKMRYFIFLNRHGRQFVEFYGRVAREKMIMTVDGIVEREEVEEDEPGGERHPSRKKKKRRYNSSRLEGLPDDG